LHAVAGIEEVGVCRAADGSAKVAKGSKLYVRKVRLRIAGRRNEVLDKELRRRGGEWGRVVELERLLFGFRGTQNHIPALANVTASTTQATLQMTCAIVVFT
jgi:hypothetical protein